jgi:hypothetical protein
LQLPTTSTDTRCEEGRAIVKNLIKSHSRTSTTRRGAALGAILASLLMGAAACSSESGTAGDSAGTDALARTAASSLTTDSTGVTEWVAHREATERAFVIEGRDRTGTALTVIEPHGGPHTASLSVDADLLEMNDQVGVLTDTLSAHSLEVITRAKEDLDGTPAAESIRAALPVGEASDIGVTSQAATTKVTTTTANCVACWLMTFGTGAEFCYKYSHCDN